MISADDAATALARCGRGRNQSLVCIIQALVFCTLTMVYIGMAIEHEEH